MLGGGGGENHVFTCYWIIVVVTVGIYMQAAYVPTLQWLLSWQHKTTHTPRLACHTVRKNVLMARKTTISQHTVHTSV